FIHAFHFKSETRSKILFVADHHVHELRNFAIHFLRAFLSTDAFPERRPIIQIVADDRAVFLCGLNGFNYKFRSGVAERGENAAGMQPAHAEFSENVIPIKIAGLELAGGGVAAIRNSHGTARAKTAFSEIQSVTCDTANAIEWQPFNEF